MKEKLSVFIDAELSEHEERQVLQSLKTDAELRRAWERYHLIRATMTRQLEALAPAGLADRVQARIDQHEQRGESLRFWPLAGGFAAAASFATVTIFAVQSFVSTPSPTVATLKNNAAVPVVAAVTKGAPAATPASAPAPKPASPGERLNVYVVGHNEFMPTTGMSGMLPYARVVTYDTDK